jgi:RHS repeat-associated protein
VFLSKTSGSATLWQTRNHNDANETGTIATSFGIGTNWADPVHDDAGNMTTVPDPAALGNNMTITYDAWNRPIQVRNAGATLIATYEYDGLNRRIVTDGQSDDYDFYYNHNWQVLEACKNGDSDPWSQMVWHHHYIDALAPRFYDSDINGSQVTHYAAHDANFNVVAMTDDLGAVQERYQYSPYGELTVLDANFTPDGDNLSDFANPYTYTARRLDAETGLYQYRNRYYHAQLGRFVSRDPIGYEGSQWNLYEYVGGNAQSGLDPMGNANLWNPWTWTTSGNTWGEYFDPRVGYQGFGSHYVEGLRDPSQMDNDLQLAHHFCKGVAVGSGTTVVIIVGAPALANGGALYLWSSGASATTATTVSSGTVTTGLLLAGGYGGYNLATGTTQAIQEGNWNQVAYNGGLLSGGAMGIKGARPHLAEGFPGALRPSPAPCLTRPIATLRYECRNMFDPRLGPPNLQWMSTAPTPASGAATLILLPGVYADNPTF